MSLFWWELYPASQPFFWLLCAIYHSEVSVFNVASGKEAYRCAIIRCCEGSLMQNRICFLRFTKCQSHLLGVLHAYSLSFPVAGLLQVASTRKPHSETGWDAQRFSSVHESFIRLQMIQPHYLDGRLNQTKSVVPKWYQTTCSHNQYKTCICSCQFRWWQLKHVFSTKNLGK